MNIIEFSQEYKVRKLIKNDTKIIYDVSIGNPMYYQYCPPYVTEEDIYNDMIALPPNMTYDDKHYVGFFDGEQLVAVMDLITNYPKKKSAFIGLFMMNKTYQNKGIGSKIINDCLFYLSKEGYQHFLLGFAKGNKQSEIFWEKNQFHTTGQESKNDKYTVVLMERHI